MSRFPLIPVVFLLLLSACGGEEEAPPAVRSVLEGRLTVSAAVDSIADYSGFEVLVAEQREGEPDTLGFATTDSTGRFEVEVAAPDRGIYPLIISRRGTILKTGELAVAEGDTATLTAEFPMGQRLLRVRSPENAAWMAYKNTKAQYNLSLRERLQQEELSADVLQQDVGMTSTILWSMRESFPGTIGAQIAAAEAVTMIEGWDDSLLVERAREIEPDNPSYVAVARAARRAEARLRGQEAALELLNEFAAKATTDEERAGIRSEVVVAYADSLQREEALEAARDLQVNYEETGWAEWADRAIYEIENLMPGMPAPEFSVATVDGDSVSIQSLRGNPVLLEFYQPQDPEYRQQLPARNALAGMAGEDSLQYVALSLEPDPDLNEAFREGREVPGQHVVLAEGLDHPVAEAYNVSVLPTRILIDGEGNIIRKYVGSTLARVQEDLVRLAGEQQSPPV